VFFLTGEEFLAAPGAGSLTGLVAERRERDVRYRALTLAPEWTGNPVPISAGDPAATEATEATEATDVTEVAERAGTAGSADGSDADADADADAADAGTVVTATRTELQGIGVVGDRVTGRARVVRDPYEVDLEPGDILVCATTDPSWTPLFMVADALVIDTGGQMSHGAIVAREMGVTCVINTITGTRDIPDGATVTVDGATGRVLVEQL